MNSDNGSKAQLFHSFLMGGFECATHRRRDKFRIDVLSDTGHDLKCEADYRLLTDVGMHTVRDGLRWHLIESEPGVYDWSSFLPMLDAAQATGMQVIWDLCHWGIPDWLDIFSENFIQRFAIFAAAAAKLIYATQSSTGDTVHSFYSIINEISFWAWVGGDEQHFYPFCAGRGDELKRQLVRASIAAIHAVRAIQPNARFVHPEPLIQVSINPLDKHRDLEADALTAATHTAAQYEALDMLIGQRHPELGGSPDLLDIIGINYYWNNQWIHQGAPTPAGHLQHRALHTMLYAVWQRYQRPILISETGAEGDAITGWLGYVGAEVRRAQRMGAHICGICLYPVMDYPGWDDERHCSSGLIEATPGWSSRRLRTEVLPEFHEQQRLFSTD